MSEASQTVDDAEVHVQPGDIILITEKQDDPIGEAVTAIDGSPYSHTVIVVERDGELMMASANQRIGDQYLSGVNLLGPDVFKGRCGLVVRPDRGTDRAAAHAECWIEDPDTKGPADFAWFLLGISGLVGVTRHMKRGHLRSLVYGDARAFVDATYRRLGVEPCGDGDRQKMPDPTNDRVRDRFYCATFVDHCYCSVDERLGFTESDPDPQDLRGMVNELRLIVERVVCADDLGGDEYGEIDQRYPDALFEEELGPVEGLKEVAELVRLAVKLLLCAADKPELPPESEATAGPPAPGEPVYPPFLGLRHMHEAAKARRGMAIVNPTGSHIPFEQIVFDGRVAP